MTYNVYIQDTKVTDETTSLWRDRVLLLSGLWTLTRQGGAA